MAAFEAVAVAPVSKPVAIETETSQVAHQVSSSRRKPAARLDLPYTKLKDRR